MKLDLRAKEADVDLLFQITDGRSNTSLRLEGLLHPRVGVDTSIVRTGLNAMDVWPRG
jgi:hypothetical protein